MDAKEAEELFDRLGVKLSLTIAYNPEANGKVGGGHGVVKKTVPRRNQCIARENRPFHVCAPFNV